MASSRHLVVLLLRRRRRGYLGIKVVEVLVTQLGAQGCRGGGGCNEEFVHKAEEEEEEEEEEEGEEEEEFDSNHKSLYRSIPECEQTSHPCEHHRIISLKTRYPIP